MYLISFVSFLSLLKKIFCELVKGGCHLPNRRVLGKICRSLHAKMACRLCDLVLISLNIGDAQARTYSFWNSGSIASQRFQSPSDACDDLYHTTFAHLLYAYRPENSSYDATYGNGHEKFDCGAELNQGHFGGFFLNVKTCSNGDYFDFVNFSCTDPGVKGVGSEVSSCAVGQGASYSFVGNPVNVVSGNKIQRDYDVYPSRLQRLQLYRTYNSMDGAWVHNFSTRLEFSVDGVDLITSDGSVVMFSKVDDAYLSRLSFGTLSHNSEQQTWLYTSSDQAQFLFGYDGRLVRYTDFSGISTNLSYKSLGATLSIDIVSDLGMGVSIVEDLKHQLLSASFPGKILTYEYVNGVLQRVSTQQGDSIIARRYIYNSPNGPGLTGIIDERGVRFATWTYDGLKRATSSEHANGAERTEVEYGDGYTKVKNSLGKATTYRYKKIGDINRIVAIEGEPSPNCPASNSGYTYNDRGQILTKTDAKGLITAYTYNDRGLETSRTEAIGTPLARTIATEWDPDRFLPVRVVEPGQTTVYSYDTQGRELGRQTASH